MVTQTGDQLGGTCGRYGVKWIAYRFSVKGTEKLRRSRRRQKDDIKKVLRIHEKETME